MNAPLPDAAGAPAARLPLAEMLALTGQRREGFEFMIAHLRTCQHPAIVETGCAREQGNFEGDGQSTLIFDAIAEELDGSVHSVDISRTAVETARRQVGGRTRIVCADSVVWLSRMKAKVDLLYLDSFDFDFLHPWPSMTHHMQELAAALHLLRPGNLVAVDDNFTYPQGTIGKGFVVDQFFRRLDVPLVYDGYQRIWQIPPRQRRA